MATKLRTFTLTDGDGAVHQYEVVLHPPTEGQRVMWTLLSHLVAPITGLLGGLVPLLELSRGRKISELLDDPEAMQRFGEVLAEVDFGKLTATLQAALAAPEMDRLVLQILSRTSRDGAPLANQLQFDEAYAGNYGELLSAVWEVVRANRFLSPPAGLRDVIKKARPR